jgi:CheY-like chemotaxis protein
MPEPPEPSIYQLRAVLLGISPIIWRRLLVRGDSTIADLRVTLQTAFGWSDDHLHRFLIHGKQYGVAYLDGITFRDDPRLIKLSDLGLRVKEKLDLLQKFTDHTRCCGVRQFVTTMEYGQNIFCNRSRLATRRQKLVITDMMMPYMDGSATIRALRRLAPKVKIIATIGLKAEGKLADAAQFGVRTFLPKPYTAEKLLKTVAAMLKEENT